MSVVANIVASYVAPVAEMRRMLRAGQREDRALAVLFGGCALIFISSLPAAFGLAAADLSVPLEARIGGAMFAWLALAPLTAYVLAAGSHVIARTIGGRGSWYGARLALFWALFASSPLWLVQVAAYVVFGAGVGQNVFGTLALGAFLYIWLGSLWAAERPEVAV